LPLQGEGGVNAFGWSFKEAGKKTSPGLGPKTLLPSTDNAVIHRTGRKRRDTSPHKGRRKRGKVRQRVQKKKAGMRPGGQDAVTGGKRGTGKTAAKQNASYGDIHKWD